MMPFIVILSITSRSCDMLISFCRRRSLIMEMFNFSFFPTYWFTLSVVIRTDLRLWTLNAINLSIKALKAICEQRLIG